MQYVRGNFFAGEAFADLDDAQTRAVFWCQEKAGMRMHGTAAARPAEVFAAEEAPELLPAPADYDVPVFKDAKVHRDHHIEIGKALYSVPGDYIGAQVAVRTDSELVKIYHRGQLIKTHPRMRPGTRSTDQTDLPEHKSAYALRDITRPIGIYAGRILDDPLPWTRMRADRAGAGVRARRRGGSVFQGTGPGRHRRAQDRFHARQGRREHPGAAATHRPGRGRPLRPRPSRIRQPRHQTGAGSVFQSRDRYRQFGDRPERSGWRQGPDTATECSCTWSFPAPRHQNKRRRNKQHRRNRDEPAQHRHLLGGEVYPVSADLRILRDLKLSGLRDALPERLVLARHRQMGHAAFLELLLADELSRRDSQGDPKS